MKNLKLAILACGVLGVISLFVPSHGFTMFAFLKLAGIKYLLPVLGGFIAAAAMGVMAMQKPPMQKWQAGVAIAGFAAVFLRLEMWTVLKHLGNSLKEIPSILLILAVFGGLIVSIMAVATDEK